MITEYYFGKKSERPVTGSLFYCRRHFIFLANGAYWLEDGEESKYAIFFGPQGAQINI